ncbi:DUF3618 domain-containing protein [Leucobacter sp. CSA1]|uniref:DUF3618 domain-containing protein n=1 Tax=Leucobacter chromiisoli TaxID=2796471 RepID=A0A934UW77_9MICO|nr:DUF3618 domain-containing protein [Leucobacter chromiisoli]MBK0419642.1 DUF3618 domain-containing protein [Leucobacter chromiisoli]
MSDSPDQIRADIERTRRGLGSDVDALADKVTPSKIVHRQTSRMRRAFGSVSERVMGTAEDAQSAASDVADQAKDMAHEAKAKAEGNPLAVGLIAFGVGLLTASLIPASEKEKDLAAEAKEGAQPLVDEVTGVAKDVASHLQEPAQEAVAAVKDRATEAVDHVKEEASGAAEGVKDRAQEARQNVADS